MLVLEKCWVLDLARGPKSFVGGVVDERSGPLALVVGVLLHGLSPGTTSGDFGTLGVGDSWGDPIAILLVIPILGLLGLWVSDSGGFILKPILRHGGILVNNLERSVLIPVLGLRGLGVGDTGFVDPAIRFGVLGVVDLSGGVDGRGKVLEEGTTLDLLTVLPDSVGVVGMDNQRVELGCLDDLGGRR